MNELFKKFRKYLPHALALTLLAVLIVLFSGQPLNFGNNNLPTDFKESFMASVLPPVLAVLTNKDRADNNVAPLEQSELLSKAAQMKANDMATRGYFSHTTPDGKLPWYFLDKVGYKYSHAGENLAVNYFESEEVAKAWMQSPSHRANVVRKNYTQVGFGVAEGIFNGRNTVFVVEFFGTPVKKAIQGKKK